MAARTRQVMAMVLVMAALLLTSCEAVLEELTTYGRAEPSDTIEDLETALNTMDIKAAIDCFDPDFGKVANFTLSVFGGVFGEMTGVDLDFNQLMEIMPFLFDYIPELSGTEMPEFQLEVLSTEYIGTGNKQAHVTVRITVSASGESVSEEAGIDMSYKDNKWTIDVPKEVIAEMFDF